MPTKKRDAAGDRAFDAALNDYKNLLRTSIHYADTKLMRLSCRDCERRATRASYTNRTGFHAPNCPTALALVAFEDLLFPQTTEQLVAARRAMRSAAKRVNDEKGVWRLEAAMMERARALAAKGGKGGTGAAKRRGDSEFYRELALKRPKTVAPRPAAKRAKGRAR